MSYIELLPKIGWAPLILTLMVIIFLVVTWVCSFDLKSAWAKTDSTFTALKETFSTMALAAKSMNAFAAAAAKLKEAQDAQDAEDRAKYAGWSAEDPENNLYPAQAYDARKGGWPKPGDARYVRPRHRELGGNIGIPERTLMPKSGLEIAEALKGFQILTPEAAANVNKCWPPYAIIDESSEVPEDIYKTFVDKCWEPSKPRPFQCMLTPEGDELKGLHKPTPARDLSVEPLAAQVIPSFSSRPLSPSVGSVLFNKKTHDLIVELDNYYDIHQLKNAFGQIVFKAIDFLPPPPNQDFDTGGAVKKFIIHNWVLTAIPDRPVENVLHTHAEEMFILLQKVCFAATLDDGDAVYVDIINLIQKIKQGGI